MKKQKGIVRWFDNKSGDGFIRVNGISIYVHWGAIANGFKLKNLPKSPFKQPKQLWTVLFPGQLVTVDIIYDSHYTQISKVY
jgi:hypothetical protein